MFTSMMLHSLPPSCGKLMIKKRKHLPNTLLHKNKWILDNLKTNEVNYVILTESTGHILEFG